MGSRDCDVGIFKEPLFSLAELCAKSIGRKKVCGIYAVFPMTDVISTFNIEEG